MSSSVSENPRPVLTLVTQAPLPLTSDSASHETELQNQVEPLKQQEQVPTRISQQILAMWRALSEEEKESWREKERQSQACAASRVSWNSHVCSTISCVLLCSNEVDTNALQPASVHACDKFGRHTTTPTLCDGKSVLHEAAAHATTVGPFLLETLGDATELLEIFEGFPPPAETGLDNALETDPKSLMASFLDECFGSKCAQPEMRH
jgi:hypothetical protein